MFQGFKGRRIAGKRRWVSNFGPARWRPALQELYNAPARRDKKILKRASRVAE
jgi:hypothetical protein